MTRPAEVNLDPRWANTVAEAVAQAGILDEETESALYKAFLAVPRTDFLEEHHPHASFDVDLPIGFDQTLTRPSVLIRMLSLLHVKRRMRVMEVGFGSGYLCAVMDQLGAQVFGIERVGPLAQRTRKTLDRLGRHGIVVRRGEGVKGWSESSPYDAMIVSYPVISEQELPIDQLKRGGTLVGVLAKQEPFASVEDRPKFGNLTVWTRGIGSLKKISFEEISLG